MHFFGSVTVYQLKTHNQQKENTEEKVLKFKLMVLNLTADNEIFFFKVVNYSGIQNFSRIWMLFVQHMM